MRLKLFFPILVIDQITKFLFDNSLTLGESRPIIRGVFHITLVHNKGGAFGLWTNIPWVFVAIASLTSAAILYSLLKGRAGPAPLAALGYRASKLAVPLEVILAGAVGNLIDRVRLGYVVDFIDLRIWPVFNISDSAVTLGTICLAWCLIKKPKIKMQNAKMGSALFFN